ncbi:uncharacterized protein METZ01_LOCUS304372, partial [marine metagenome]
MFKVKQYILIGFCISSFCFAQEDQRILDPRLHEVWTIEDLGFKELVRNSINNFINGNPEDSLPRVDFSDKVIIIVKKTNLTTIFQLRYGSSEPFYILSKEYVEWALSKRLRYEILGGNDERKDYHYINNKTYIMSSKSSNEEEYYLNRDSWAVKDRYVSVGSPVFDRIDLKFLDIGGAKILPNYALTIRSGNELLGFPNSTQGHITIGLLNPTFEMGVQIPNLAISKEFPRFGIADIDTSKMLTGGIGGYAKIALFGTQLSISFSGLSDNQLITENIEDSTFIDIMSYSFLGLRQITERSIGNFGFLKIRGGVGIFEISHRSMALDGSFINRVK